MKKNDETYKGLVEICARMKKDPEKFLGVLVVVCETVPEGERIEVIQSGSADMLLQLGREAQQAVVETVMPPEVIEKIKQKMRALARDGSIPSCEDPNCEVHRNPVMN